MMGRRKGSLNKNNNYVQSDFEGKPEVIMANNAISKDENENELEILNQELDQARIELEKTRIEIEAKKQELKSMPVQSAVKDIPGIKIQNESLKEKIADKKARDSVMVTGKFYNLRVKGQSVKLPYHKYGDEPVKWHPFDHGKVYTIPKGFADQINGGEESDPCYYTPHFVKNEGMILDPDDPESGIHSVDTSDKKYSFVPLNF